MANWQMHGTVRAPRLPDPPLPPPPAVPQNPTPQYSVPQPATPLGAGSGFCSECGRPFPTSQLLNLGNASVCAQCKPIYLQRVREGGQAIGARHYGGFWIRFVALVIDGILLAVVNGILTVPLRLVGIGGMMTDSAAAFGAGMGLLGFSILVSMAIGIVYNVYFISTRGATVGKMLLGLKIIRSDGSPVSAGRALGRYLAQFVSGMILGIGYIIAAFDSEKRALHDHLADTRVIYTR